MPLECFFSRWDMWVLEGFNQLTAMQKNELALDSIQGIAKGIYLHLGFCLNCLFLAHTVFGQDTWFSCSHSSTMFIISMGKSLRLSDPSLIWLDVFCQKTPFSLFSFFQTLNIYASYPCQFEYETSGKKRIPFYFLNNKYIFPKSLNNCDNFFSGNLSCDSALKQTPAACQRKGLIYEECVFSNSCENLSLSGLWNTMACTCLVTPSQSLAAQMPEESVLFQTVPWPLGRLAGAGPIPWGDWICWIPCNLLESSV